jgi:hypothetical protein
MGAPSQPLGCPHGCQQPNAAVPPTNAANAGGGFKADCRFASRPAPLLQAQAVSTRTQALARASAKDLEAELGRQNAEIERLLQELEASKVRWPACPALFSPQNERSFGSGGLRNELGFSVCWLKK